MGEALNTGKMMMMNEIRGLFGFIPVIDFLAAEKRKVRVEKKNMIQKMKKQCWHEHGGQLAERHEICMKHPRHSIGAQMWTIVVEQRVLHRKVCHHSRALEISQRLRLHHHNVCQQARALALVLQDHLQV